MAARSLQSIMPQGAEQAVAPATPEESLLLGNLEKMAESLIPNGGNTLHRETADLAKGLGLTEGQLDFMHQWLRCRGDAVLLSETGAASPRQLMRHLASPAVIRLLELASRTIANMPSPVLTKDELAMTWTMVSRDPTAPESFQKEARQEVAKLMGYYQGVQSDNVNVGVQVILKGGLDG